MLKLIKYTIVPSDGSDVYFRYRLTDCKVPDECSCGIYNVGLDDLEYLYNEIKKEMNL